LTSTRSNESFIPNGGRPPEFRRPQPLHLPRQVLYARHADVRSATFKEVRRGAGEGEL
jgi:hypothetical protein